MQEEVKISIIIPAYNAANYLPRCIESVACQDLPYRAYEVIVVNDGSTDHTVAILENYSTKYPFLKYVTTENGGLSRARNRGLDESVGEYVLFVDSDDTISPNVLKQAYAEMIKGKLDIMLMNYQYLSAEGESMELPLCMDRNQRMVVSGKEFLYKDCYPPMVWCYMFRRKFLTEQNLQMMAIWHEDEEFTPRAIYLAKQIKYYPLLYYNYYLNNQSYMNAYKESNLLYVVEAMGSLHRFKQVCGSDKRALRYFDSRIAGVIMHLFKNSIKQGYQNQDVLVKKIKEEGLLPLKPRRSSFYYKLFNFSPILFENYYRLRKNKKKVLR